MLSLLKYQFGDFFFAYIIKNTAALCWTQLAESACPAAVDANDATKQLCFPPPGFAALALADSNYYYYSSIKMSRLMYVWHGLGCAVSIVLCIRKCSPVSWTRLSFPSGFDLRKPILNTSLYQQCRVSLISILTRLPAAFQSALCFKAASWCAELKDSQYYQGCCREIKIK